MNAHDKPSIFDFYSFKANKICLEYGLPFWEDKEKKTFFSDLTHLHKLQKFTFAATTTQDNQSAIICDFEHGKLAVDVETGILLPVKQPHPESQLYAFWALYSLLNWKSETLSKSKELKRNAQMLCQALHSLFAPERVSLKLKHITLALDPNKVYLSENSIKTKMALKQKSTNMHPLFVGSPSFDEETHTLFLWQPLLFHAVILTFSDGEHVRLCDMPYHPYFGLLPSSIFNFSKQLHDYYDSDLSKLETPLYLLFQRLPSTAFNFITYCAQIEFLDKILKWQTQSKTTLNFTLDKCVPEEQEGKVVGFKSFPLNHISLLDSPPLTSKMNFKKTGPQLEIQNLKQTEAIASFWEASSQNLNIYTEPEKHLVSTQQKNLKNLSYQTLVQMEQKAPKSLMLNISGEITQKDNSTLLLDLPQEAPIEVLSPYLAEKFDLTNPLKGVTEHFTELEYGLNITQLDLPIHLSPYFFYTCPTTQETFYSEPPPALELAMNVASNGIESCFSEKRSYLATQSNHQNKRKNELLLYRHAGFGLWLITELYSTWAQESSVAKVKKNVLKKSAFVVLKILKSKTSPNPQESISNILKDLVSKKFITNLRKTIDYFLNTGNYQHGYFTEKSLITVDARNAVKSLFLSLSESLLAQEKDKLFLKTKMGLLFDFECLTSKKEASHLLQHKSLDSIISHFHLTFLRETPLPLLTSTQELTIKEKRINTLEEGDLGLKMQIQDGEDWFDLEPQYFFKGKPLSMLEAQNFASPGLIEHNGKFYFVDPKRLPKMKWLDYFWNKIQRNPSDQSSSAYEDTSSIYRLPRAEILEALALKRAGIPFIGNQKTRWEKACTHFDKIEAKSTKALPKDILAQSTLKPFQKEGVQRLLNLYNMEMGCVLADEMGLGKTIQMIAFLSQLNKEKTFKSALIVVPTSLVFNWKSELTKFAPQLKAEELLTENKADIFNRLLTGQTQILIASYGQLPQNIDSLNELNLDIVIFDEAQNLKNIKALRTTAARKLKAKTKYALTGTPMENHFGEFYSIFDLICPKSLGEYGAFLKDFNLKNYDQQAKTTTGESFDKIDFLKQKVRPLMLRREKKLVLKDLPDLQESVVELQFDKKQKKIYKDLAISWNHKVQSIIDSKGENKSQLEMLTALLRLRQTCTLPQAVPNVKYKEISPKLELLFDKLENLLTQGHSSLVFTSFVSTLDFIKDQLSKRGVKCLTICGKDSKKQRENTIKDFQEDSTPKVLAMTLKTGGVGLNLTKANYVFHLEPWWNPAAENQATDRSYRLGQDKKVNVYRYIMKHSVEERIQNLKAKKSKAFDALFAINKSESTDLKSISNSKLTKADFDYLISDVLGDQ